MKTLVSKETVEMWAISFIEGEKYEVCKPASLKQRVSTSLNEFKKTLPPERLKHWSPAVEKALVYMYTNDEKRKGKFYLVTGKFKRFNGKVSVYVHEEISAELCDKYLKEI